MLRKGLRDEDCTGFLKLDAERVWWKLCIQDDKLRVTGRKVSRMVIKSD